MRIYETIVSAMKRRFMCFSMQYLRSDISSFVVSKSLFGMDTPVTLGQADWVLALQWNINCIL